MICINRFVFSTNKNSIRNKIYRALNHIFCLKIKKLYDKTCIQQIKSKYKNVILGKIIIEGYIIGIFYKKSFFKFEFLYYIFVITRILVILIQKQAFPNILIKLYHFLLQICIKSVNIFAILIGILNYQIQILSILSQLTIKLVI